MFRHENLQARHRTEQVGPGGLDPAHVAAQKAAEFRETSLQPAQQHPAGIGIHTLWELDLQPCMRPRERLPVTTQQQDFLHGMGLGLGLFLVKDEGLNQRMGLPVKSKNYHWEAHTRGLAAHLVLKLTINAALNQMRAPRPVPQQLQRFDEHFDANESEHMPVTSERHGAYRRRHALIGSAIYAVQQP